jgi:hypothetical protein
MPHDSEKGRTDSVSRMISASPEEIYSAFSDGETYMKWLLELAEIVFSGARPVIDPVSAATGATLDSSQFLSLPAQRDFRALITFLPELTPVIMATAPTSVVLPARIMRSTSMA